MGNKIWFVVGGVLLLLILWAFGSYNGLVSGDEGVKKAWADVQTQYQRRLDLIENLVNTAKGSAQFEQTTLQSVVEARSAWAKASSAPTLNEQVRATEQAAPVMSSALSRLLVTVEAYPQLKSTEAFRDVMTGLEGTENRIATARRDFNGSVQSYNVQVRTFPSNIFAKLFGFELKESFKADEGADKAPKVEFDFAK